MSTSLLRTIVKNKSIATGLLMLGFTGGLIGYYLGNWLAMLFGLLTGGALGGFVGHLGARIFFISVLTGTVILGALGFRIGGTEIMEICAGTGAAMGGFIGIVIENIVQPRKRNERRFMDTGLLK